MVFNEMVTGQRYGVTIGFWLLAVLVLQAVIMYQIQWKYTDYNSHKFTDLSVTMTSLRANHTLTSISWAGIGNYLIAGGTDGSYSSLRHRRSTC